MHHCSTALPCFSLTSLKMVSTGRGTGLSSSLWLLCRPGWRRMVTGGSLLSALPVPILVAKYLARRDDVPFPCLTLSADFYKKAPKY